MECPFPAVAHGSTDRRPLDYDEARRALALFADPAPGSGLHLQAKPHWRTRVVPGADLDAALAAVRALDAGDSVYFGLNPCPPGTPSGPDVKASEILCRRWLAVDVDRPKGDADKKLSATAAEKGLARAVADELTAGLAADGWPAPVLIDTGNGYCPCYRIDLPNDKLSQALLRNVLRVLAGRFDRDGVTVDPVMHNADRVIKLPGSWACKGPDTPDRPHRPCRLVSAPDVPQVVPVELLKKAAGIAPAAANGANGPPHDVPFPATATSAGTASYARAALERECGKMACTKAGGLNVQLNKSGFALGQLVGAGLLGEQEVFDALLRAARAAGADDPAKDEDTLRRGIAAGKAEPRKKDDLVIPASASERVPAGEKIIYRASSVVPRAVEWLWPGRVPLGKLTTFAGVKGMGKTFVLCDITARVTRGSDWPGAGGECAAPGQVLFISGEDDPEDTLVPRLIELGADLDRVLFLKTEVKDAFTLADLKTLDRALSEAGPGVRFIAIDPPTAFLGGVDDHKNADLRGVLSPLASWSAKHRAATAFITHVSKPGGMKVEAMMRVMGSVAWVNAVRAAHMFARDPDNPERRLFLPLACNLCEEHKALAYRIAKTDSLARVEWLGEVDTTADEAMNAPRNAPRKVLARDWLIDLFRQKLEWASDDFWASARQHGVSKNAIDEARVQLALPKPRRVCGSSGNVSWVWWVPPDWKHLAQNAAP